MSSDLASSFFKKKQVGPESAHGRRPSAEGRAQHPLSDNKWSQYQVDRWFRLSNAKPKLRAQVRSTFVPNLSSHKTAEEIANCESE